MKSTIYMLLCSLFFAACSSHYTKEDFARVPKIDAHIHYDYANPVLLEQAEKDNFRLLTVNVESSSSPDIDIQQSIALKLIKQYKDIIAYLTTISTANWLAGSWSQNAIDRIDNSINDGASGVKIWKNVGMQLQDADSSYVQIDHPRIDPVLRHMEQQHIPLLAHIGEPKNCWLPLDEMTTNNDRNYFKNHPQYHMYLHPEMPSYEEIISARDNILGKHKDLKVVGAHFGSVEWNLDSLAALFEKYPNFAVDMAARIGHMHYLSDQDYEKVRNFFIIYHDRILYGTDIGISSETLTSGERFHNQWLSDWIYLATGEMQESDLIGKQVKGLQLPKFVINSIYYNNARRWYSLNNW